MRRLSWIGAALLAAACESGPSPTAPDTPESRAPSLDVVQEPPRSHIVVFRAGVLDSDALAGTLVAQSGGRLLHTYNAALRGFAAELPAAAVEALANHPSVAYVEPDGVMTKTTDQPDPPSWGLDRIDQRSLPLNDVYSYGRTGAGVNVYVIDTGIRTTHQELAGRAFGAFTSINDGNGTDDCDGHGTHVSGTIGGTAVGVAKDVTLYAVRVLNCGGSGTTSGVIAGVDWVTANHVKPAVANMSLGGGFSTALNTAVTNSIGQGVTYSLSAGNEDFDACFFSPGSAPAALTVGSTTITDTRSSFSNYGPCVDLFAPGSAIYSAYGLGDAMYATMSGTSMAAPHVAGVAARYLEADPGAVPAAVGGAILADATPGVVADPGPGSPNLLLFAAGELVPDLPPTAAFTWACTDLTCTFDGTSSTDDNGVTYYEWNLDDGTFPQGPIQTVTYDAPGTYDVGLRVGDAAGQFDVVFQSIPVTGAPPPVDEPPTAAFTYACTGLTCTFDGTSSTDDNGVTYYEWNLGNGTFPLGPIQSVTYAAAGTYTVGLRVGDAAGQLDVVFQDVTVTDGPPPPVDEPPTAAFTWSCSGLTCTFDASSSTDDNGIVLYEWNLANGTFPRGMVQTVTYDAPGTYAVGLQVADAAGQSDLIFQDVAVTSDPAPSG